MRRNSARSGGGGLKSHDFSSIFLGIPAASWIRDVPDRYPATISIYLRECIGRKGGGTAAVVLESGGGACGFQKFGGFRGHLSAGEGGSGVGARARFVGGDTRRWWR